MTLSQEEGIKSSACLLLRIFLRLVFLSTDLPSTDLRVSANTDLLFRAAAEQFAASADEAIREHGRFTSRSPAVLLPVECFPCWLLA